MEPMTFNHSRSSQIPYEAKYLSWYGLVKARPADTAGKKKNAATQGQSPAAFAGTHESVQQSGSTVLGIISTTQACIGERRDCIAT